MLLYALLSSKKYLLSLWRFLSSSTEEGEIPNAKVKGKTKSPFKPKL